jgi:hypothetical protein
VDRPSVPTLGATIETGPLLEALLLSFGGLFTDPVGWPPKRVHDHRIILKPDAQPVAVRPYRYPTTHKDELERQCAAMIEQGIIRHSDSPFSSFVLLVKKPNGSWRFCVDYRALMRSLSRMLSRSRWSTSSMVPSSSPSWTSGPGTTKYA